MVRRILRVRRAGRRVSRASPQPAQPAAARKRADGHPEEDMMDALRGGIRDALPDGSVPARDFARVNASRVF